MIKFLEIIFLFVTYVSAYSFASVSLKQLTDIVSIKFAISLLAYVICFLIWFRLIKILPLSVAFPLASGALIIATQVLGCCVFKEKLILSHVLAIAFILFGLGLLFFDIRFKE